MYFGNDDEAYNKLILALHACTSEDEDCDCPYNEGYASACLTHVMQDALEKITELQTNVDLLMHILYEIRSYTKAYDWCALCEHDCKPEMEQLCLHCCDERLYGNWKWNGGISDV